MSSLDDYFRRVSSTYMCLLELFLQFVDGTSSQSLWLQISFPKRYCLRPTHFISLVLTALRRAHLLFTILSMETNL